MVIGTFAYCGSGQDTLADSMCRLFGYKKYCIGDIIRQIAIREKLPLTRDNLRQIRIKYDLKYGREYFPRIIADQIISDNYNNVVITGIRTMQEYHIFKKIFDIKIIFVYADEKIRYKRMLNRKSEKDESNIDLLKIQMEKEKQMFDYEDLLTVIDCKFDFSMDLESYMSKEYEIVNSLLLNLM